MKVTTTTPQKEYPYLAVWIGEDRQLTNSEISLIVVSENVVLISLVECEEGNDKVPYVQYLLGGKAGHITKNEDDYCPLPKGYTITICQ